MAPTEAAPVPGEREGHAGQGPGRRSQSRAATGTRAAHLTAIASNRRSTCAPTRLVRVQVQLQVQVPVQVQSGPPAPGPAAPARLPRRGALPAKGAPDGRPVVAASAVRSPPPPTAARPGVRSPPRLPGPRPRRWRRRAGRAEPASPAATSTGARRAAHGVRPVAPSLPLQVGLGCGEAGTQPGSRGSPPPPPPPRQHLPPRGGRPARGTHLAERAAGLSCRDFAAAAHRNGKSGAGSRGAAECAAPGARRAGSAERRSPCPHPSLRAALLLFTFLQPGAGEPSRAERQQQVQKVLLRSLVPKRRGL
eukprot:XP_022282879.1 uncharacterized protein LOC102157282 [Canis lupus familiaris]